MFQKMMKKIGLATFIFLNYSYATDLVSLLNYSQVKTKPKKSANSQVFDTLFGQIYQKQKNKSYQAALAILNNQKLSDAYHNNLFNIELILSDYTTQVLQKYSAQQDVNKKSMSFVSMLKLITPNVASAKKSATGQLSSLLTFIQQDTHANGKTADHVSLLSLVAQATPKTAQLSSTKSNLLKFLQATHSSTPVKTSDHASLLSLVSKSAPKTSDHEQANMLNLLSAKATS